jgi:hypothetical protein
MGWASGPIVDRDVAAIFSGEADRSGTGRAAAVASRRRRTTGNRNHPRAQLYFWGAIVRYKGGCVDIDPEHAAVLRRGSQAINIQFVKLKPSVGDSIPIHRCVGRKVTESLY